MPKIVVVALLCAGFVAGFMAGSLWPRPVPGVVYPVHPIIDGEVDPDYVRPNSLVRDGIEIPANTSGAFIICADHHCITAAELRQMGQ